MRHVADAFMDYEKGRVVVELCGARERKRKETGKKVGGRKSHAKLWPEVVAEAHRLRRAKAKTGRLSYREISARLKDAGYRDERGEPINPQSVRAMIEGPQPRPQRRPYPRRSFRQLPVPEVSSGVCRAIAEAQVGTLSVALEDVISERSCSCGRHARSDKNDR